MAEVELWVPVVRLTEGAFKGHYVPDVPRSASGLPSIRLSASIPVRVTPPATLPAEAGAGKLAEGESAVLVSTCRIRVAEGDAPSVTAACNPSDLDYALVRVCTDIQRAQNGGGFDSLSAKSVFNEIAAHITATGDDRKALLQRALEEAVLRGLPVETAQEIAATLEVAK